MTTMDVREMLIDILRKPIFPHELADPIEAVADYLLDSGVTVHKWIPVTERLPENIANRVLVVCERSNGVFYAHYEKPFWINLETDKPFISTVTHWMPLPELPKGE